MDCQGAQEKPEGRPGGQDGGPQNSVGGPPSSFTSPWSSWPSSWLFLSSLAIQQANLIVKPVKVEKCYPN